MRNSTKFRADHLGESQDSTQLNSGERGNSWTSNHPVEREKKEEQKCARQKWAAGVFDAMYERTNPNRAGQICIVSLVVQANCTSGPQNETSHIERTNERTGSELLKGRTFHTRTKSDTQADRGAQT